MVILAHQNFNNAMELQQVHQLLLLLVQSPIALQAQLHQHALSTPVLVQQLACSELATVTALVPQATQQSVNASLPRPTVSSLDLIAIAAQVVSTDSRTARMFVLLHMALLKATFVFVQAKDMLALTALNVVQSPPSTA